MTPIAPPVPLPRPITPVTPNIGTEACKAVSLDAWINMAMDQSCWSDRAEVLAGAIANSFAGNNDHGLEPILALSIRIALSAALEYLAEREIGCLQAAVFYSLSMLPEWQNPALRWIEPIVDTLCRDWIDERPAIGRLAAHCDDLPAWFGRRA